MPTYEVVSDNRVDVLIGSTAIPDPVLLLEVDGVPTAGVYTIQQAGFSSRYIFPTIDSNGNIYLSCVGQTYGEDIPATSFNVKIYIAE
jgi:hypothetical protein